MTRTEQKTAREITYYRHIVKPEPATRSTGPVPARQASRRPVDRSINTYCVHGTNGYSHPWITTSDFSRARAVAQSISLAPGRPRPYICVSGLRYGSDVPILKVCDGVGYSWSGAQDYRYLLYAGAA